MDNNNMWVNINGVSVSSNNGMIWKLKLLFGRDQQIMYSNDNEEILSSINIVGLRNKDCITLALEYVKLEQEGFKKVG